MSAAPDLASSLGPDAVEAAAGAIFLDGLRRPLLLLHHASSVLLLGASTHHAWRLVSWWSASPRGLRQERLWARITSGSYALCFALGAALYPSYRYRVRGLYLDRWAPWASRLFDIKELYAALVLLLALGLGLVPPPLPRTGVPAGEAGREVLRWYIRMSVLVCATVWFEVIAGVLVTSVRGLG